VPKYNINWKDETIHYGADALSFVYSAYLLTCCFRKISLTGDSLLLLLVVVVDGISVVVDGFVLNFVNAG